MRFFWFLLSWVKEAHACSFKKSWCDLTMLLVIRKVGLSLQMLDHIRCDEAIMQENQSGTVY